MSDLVAFCINLKDFLVSSKVNCTMPQTRLKVPKINKACRNESTLEFALKIMIPLIRLR